MQRIISITVLGLVTGSLAAFMAVGFVTLIEIADAGLIAPVLEQGYFRIHQWFAILAALVIGGIVVSLLRYWSRPEQPQGVAQTIAAAHGLENHMPMPTAFRSVLASLVSLTSGASVGQYGPLAHAGASLGLLFVKLIGRGPGTRSIAIACGVAAAISTAFHAPIAGVVFAHEVILRHYSLRAFAPVTVASSVGYLVARLVLDHEPLFVVSELVVIKSPEYLLFALIGVSGGLLAVLLMRFVTSAVTHAPRLPVAPWLQPPLAGVLLALLALTVPEVLGVGGGSMNAVLNGQVESLRLVWILLAKILATGLCLGLGYVGGLFSPALVVGVMFGALAGQATDWLFDSAFTDLVTYAVKPNYRTLGPRFGSDMPAAAAAVGALDPDRVAESLSAGEPIVVSVSGTDHPLAEDDLVMEMEPLEGYQVEAQSGHAVALSLELDEGLIAEGLAREIVHAVQNARKNAGLEITDRIALDLGGDPELLAAAEAHAGYLSGEVLATSLTFSGGEGESAESQTVDGRDLVIGIGRSG